MSNHNTDKTIDNTELDNKWKDWINSKKEKLMDELSSDIYGIIINATCTKIRYFDLPEIWGIEIFLNVENKIIRIYSKPTILGDYLYSEEKVLTDYWNIGHDQCSTLHELFLNFIRNECEISE